MFRILRSRKGLTLVEGMIGTGLVAVTLVCVLGAFLVARFSVPSARHRLAAMNAVKEYMEQEIAQGYAGGEDGSTPDYYATVTSGDSIAVTLDTRGTADTADDLIGSIYPAPYPATLATYNGVQYKIVGFEISWAESGSGSRTCYERAVTHIAHH